MIRRLLNDAEARLFSRELSWLSFNDRVLDEAEDPSNPLLERLKYLTIVSSNLEEFFMVRVAQLYRQIANQKNFSGPDNFNEQIIFRDGFPLPALLRKIRNWVEEQKDRQARQYEAIRIGLGKEGLYLEEEASPLARNVFEKKVLPFLAPTRLAEGDSLPLIYGRRLHLLARHSKSYSVIRIPSALPRVLIENRRHVFLVDRLINVYKEDAFRSQDVQEMISFKVLRDSEIDMDFDEDEDIDILKEAEAALEERNFGPIVRVDVDSLTRTTAVKWLQRKLNVDADRFFQLSLPVGLRDIAPVYDLIGYQRLKYVMKKPKRPRSLPAGLSRVDFFKVLDSRDILLHHPFVSFDPVVELVRHASRDPKVTRICQTLYRTSGKSSIVQALVEAAKNKKNVTVLLEIKARFDEANNIRWARELEKAGARVIYGTPDIKVHAKLSYVEKIIGDQKRTYVHVATGNYHPVTAKFYTDIGIMTSNEKDSAEAAHLFHLMEDLDAKGNFSVLDKPESFARGFKRWVVAPTQLHQAIIGWIDAETEHAKDKKPAAIRAKMNGLVDQNVIEALYRASQAGVKIDLLVRGICCLRPGVRGLSENIRVRSIVDKYLEHSRFFIFENGGKRKAYISSADWMPRNFFRRIELAVPVSNPEIIEYLSESIWKTYDSDNVRSRVCDSNGIYKKVVAWNQPECRAQFAFEKMKAVDFPKFNG